MSERSWNVARMSAIHKKNYKADSQEGLYGKSVARMSAIHKENDEVDSQERLFGRNVARMSSTHKNSDEVDSEVDSPVNDDDKKEIKIVFHDGNR